MHTKEKVTALSTASILALAFLIPLITVHAAPPTSFTTTYNGAQFQWRAFGGPFGAWSYVYQNDAGETSTYSMQGNTLHTSLSFSPSVTNIVAAQTNYVYNKETGLWIQHASGVSYNIAGYYCADITQAVCNGPYTNYWTGYLDFGGSTPSATTFVHGVGYQWVYYFSPLGQSDTSVTANIPNAQWDAKVGAWLIGFSVYLWDSGSQSYTIVFPTTFPEPVPSNVYNPLVL